MVKKNLLFIAGPCAVEDKEQIVELAEAVKRAGANMLRGGLYKPRTSPYSFQGLGKEGLKYLRYAKEKTGLPIVTEVMGSEDIILVSKVADVLQVGSKNMQNYDLLKKLGQRAPEIPILLKRGMCATKEELLGAIDYLREYGHNDEIIVCERGIRTSNSCEYSRNTLDLALLADLKESNFPYRVLVDPSHASGRSDLIKRLSFASIAAGADGLIIETKMPDSRARSDDEQSITPDILEEIITATKRIYSAVNKSISIKNAKGCQCPVRRL